MSNVLIEENTVKSIADAIRAKKGVSTKFLPSEMPDAIASIDASAIGDLKYAEVTMEFTATKSNPYQVQLEAVSSIIFFRITEMPDPPSQGYIALYGLLYDTGDLLKYGILRPNGTIGSDNQMITFDKSTGVLTMGGAYGEFVEGLTYRIYQIALLS